MSYNYFGHILIFLIVPYAMLLIFYVITNFKYYCEMVDFYEASCPNETEAIHLII